MFNIMISILVLFLVGVVRARNIIYYDNGTNDAPIISKAQERRICAELCMAGLGGEPCGDDCLDVIPQGLPTESQSQSELNSQEERYKPRTDACPLLCANRLGYPLCSCNYTEVTPFFFTVNYFSICSYFCLSYEYRIYGCNTCSYYKTMNETGKSSLVPASGSLTKRSYNWNAWCVQMCQEGDGGSACYCDLLPLALQLDKK